MSEKHDFFMWNSRFLSEKFTHNLSIDNSKESFKSSSTKQGHSLEGLHRCWWRMLETKCVGDNLEILMIDLICWWPKNHQHNAKKSRQHKVTIMKLTPTSLSPSQRLTDSITEQRRISSPVVSLKKETNANDSPPSQLHPFSFEW